MDRLLAKAQSRGATFASVRHAQGSMLQMSVDNDTATIDQIGTGGSYMLRLLCNGSFIYKSTTSEPRYSDLKAALRLGIEKGTDAVPAMPALKGSHIIKPDQDFGKAPEDKLKDLKELRPLVLGLNPAIRRVELGYSEALAQKEYSDTNGRQITQQVPMSVVGIEVVAGDPGNTASAYASAATTQGYVLGIADIDVLLADIKRRLDAQLNGVAVKPGEYGVVLGPGPVGTFAHEAIGHLAEADGAENGLLFKLKGRKIADPTVSISDSPTLQTPLTNCNMKYDDEGTEAITARIVDQGVVKDFLTDLKFSSRLGLPATGNARAQTASVPELIRMRNTYVERGTMSMDELVKSIKDGYLIEWAPTGETNPSDGTFQFAVDEGYRIENGEVKSGLKSGVSISGFTMETLADIDGVANDFATDTGSCGKGGQWAPVSSGGPHVRLRKLKVG